MMEMLVFPVVSLVGAGVPSRRHLLDEPTPNILIAFSFVDFLKNIWMET